MDGFQHRGINYKAWLFGLFVAVVLLVVLFNHHRSRHKHHAKLIKTKSHRVYVENDDGSCWAFDGGGGSDVSLPSRGSESFRLPPGKWTRANPPREDDVEEEEESEVEESDVGEPEADADGDVGADSEGASPADSGGDSGGDGGGDGGGGDGGGGDGG